LRPEHSAGLHTTSYPRWVARRAPSSAEQRRAGRHELLERIPHALGARLPGMHIDEDACPRPGTRQRPPSRRITRRRSAVGMAGVARGRLAPTWTCRVSPTWTCRVSPTWACLVSFPPPGRVSFPPRGRVSFPHVDASRSPTRTCLVPPRGRVSSRFPHLDVSRSPTWTCLVSPTWACLVIPNVPHVLAVAFGHFDALGGECRRARPAPFRLRPSPSRPPQRGLARPVLVVPLRPSPSRPPRRRSRRLGAPARAGRRPSTRVARRAPLRGHTTRAFSTAQERS